SALALPWARVASVSHLYSNVILFRRAVAYGMKAFMRKAPTALALAAILMAGCSERTTPASGAAAAGASARNDAPRPDAPSAPRPPKSPNATVDELVRENLDAEMVEQPIAATWLGVHAWDDRIDDVRPDAQSHQILRLRALLDRLRALDDKQL